MVNLIILIISIGLLAAIAVAGLWWGGDAFTTAGAEANAAEVVNFRDQLEAAKIVCRTDPPPMRSASDCDDLSVLEEGDPLTHANAMSTDYLTSLEMAGLRWFAEDTDSDGNYDAYRSEGEGPPYSTLSDAFCESLHERVGGDSVAIVSTSTPGDIPATGIEAGCQEDSSGQPYRYAYIRFD